MKYKDYYKLLGVTQKATQEEIIRSFKESVRRSHPDLNPGDALAEERIKEIIEAYAVLRDGAKRRAYDAFGRDLRHGQTIPPPPGFDISRVTDHGTESSDAAPDADGGSTFFEFIANESREAPGRFEERAKPSADQQKIAATLELTPEEAFVGVSKDVAVRVATKGPDGLPGHQDRTFSVHIPGGVQDGTIIRLTERGHVFGGDDSGGNLYIKVKILPLVGASWPNSKKRKPVDFDGKVGSHIAIELQGSRERFNSRLIGWKTDEYVIMEFPDKPHIKTDIRPGKGAIVRYLSCHGHVYGFKTIILDVVLLPIRFIIATYPSETERVALRGTTRVNVYLSAIIMIGDTRIPGHIIDLSTTGCRFAIDRAALFLLGNEANISINFKLLDNDTLGLTIPVKVIKTYTLNEIHFVAFKFLDPRKKFRSDIADYVHKLMMYSDQPCSITGMEL